MHDRDPIYLDHNATTPLLPEVVDAMLPYLHHHFGNPSSGHIYGKRAYAALEHARAQVAALLGCAPDEIIFTSGGTEANNLAIRGVMEANSRRAIVTSCIEHPATARPCAWLEAHNAQVTRLDVDAHGQVLPQDAEQTITTDTALVTVMHSNNETGVLQPISALAEIAHKSGALVHTDAAQSVGKVSINVDDLGVDLLSVAGHKLYAPKGVGALYVRHRTHIAPFTLGASHEHGLRPGTENVASIVGLGMACAVALRDLEQNSTRLERLRDTLHDQLAAAIPGLVLNGHPILRLNNTLNVRFPKVSGDAVLVGAPEIAASTGSACHAGYSSASAVILAMGVPLESALGSVRLTLGRGTTEDDIQRAADALVRSYLHIRS